MRRAISLSTIGLQYVAAIMAVVGGLALVLAITGVYLVVGAAVGFAGARAISAALMGTIPFDAATFAAATAFLATTALLAAYVPARRALAIDPAHTLRAD